MTRAGKSNHLLTLCGVVLLYWCTSWAAIFMNKWIYTRRDQSVSIDTPYFITLLQFIAPSLVLYVFSKLNNCFSFRSSFPDIKISLRMLKIVFPLSFLFCLMILMSNLCLKYVEVSFYQISRSLGIPMIPLLNYILFHEPSTCRTVISCVIIVIGYSLGIDGELHFSLRGTLFGMGASAVGTLYTIYLKRYLSNVIKDRWLLTFYTNITSCFIMPLFVYWNGEIPILWQSRSSLNLSFFFWVFISGVVGLIVGLTTYLQIQYTSSLSHNISGVMKNCIQSFIGAKVYHTPITIKGVFGIMLVVYGSISYAWERMTVMKKPKESPTIQITSSPSNSNE